MAHELKELKKTNEAYISQNRYLELKNFCKQYREWKEAVGRISLLQSATFTNEKVQTSNTSDPTAELATRRLYYLRRIETVDQTLLAFDEDVRPYIFEAVTEGVSWEVLRARENWIPVSKHSWYKLLRGFYALLDRQQYSQAV